MPSGIVRQSFCGISGLLPTELCHEAGLVRSDLFNAKYVPKLQKIQLEKVDFCHVKRGTISRTMWSTPIEFLTTNGVTLK
ncbi:hypothetical protein KHA80_16055 [Anaerobacillus sp. HL2]|nr:hypothetical protein KHA80_16055 [Anaerobacillus sp. HL2]